MYDASFCPQFHHAVELVGRRWTGVIVRALMGGAVRFSDISGSIPGLSDRLLSERLKELEAEGIVQRSVFADTPVRIEYRLTEKGMALDQTISAIAHWAEEWGTTAPHPDCVESDACQVEHGLDSASERERAATDSAVDAELAASLRQ